jgi:hypothetical protein
MTSDQARQAANLAIVVSFALGAVFGIVLTVLAMPEGFAW